MFLFRWFLMTIALALFTNAAFALDPNKADVHLVTDLPNMNVVVNPGGHGCSAGTYWDIVVGGCTPAVQLRTESTSRSCTCSCAELGSCTSAQNGTYPVFGWRLPTSGTEQISYYGATSWGPCFETSSSCAAAPAPPSDGGGGVGGGTASVGTTYKIIYAMICDGSSPDYYSAPANVPVSVRNLIISQYRGWEGGRCPEASGYKNWVNYVNGYAYDMWAPNPGVPDEATYRAAYSQMTAPAIDEGANKTGEKTAAGIAAANHLCQLAADDQFGAGVKAEYVLYSGNQCIVTGV